MFNFLLVQDCHKKERNPALEALENILVVLLIIFTVFIWVKAALGGYSQECEVAESTAQSTKEEVAVKEKPQPVAESNTQTSTKPLTEPPQKDASIMTPSQPIMGAQTQSQVSPVPQININVETTPVVSSILGVGLVLAVILAYPRIHKVKKERRRETEQKRYLENV